MTKPKVLLLGDIDQYVHVPDIPALRCRAQLTLSHDSAHEEWSSLSSIADIVTPKSKGRKDFIAECKSGAFDGAVAAYRTFGSFAITGMIDEEVVQVLPDTLKVISHNGSSSCTLKIPLE